MRLLELVRNVKNDDDGAVTVDWVVLTAAIVILGAAVVTTISPGLTNTSGYISSQIGSSYP